MILLVKTMTKEYWFVAIVLGLFVLVFIIDMVRRLIKMIKKKVKDAKRKS